MRYLSLYILILLLIPIVTLAGQQDYDNNDLLTPNDANKTAEELTKDASVLFLQDKPLEARTKLLRALKKDPDYYPAHMYLGGYYLTHVGHYRMAYRYIKRAFDLFHDKYGDPPYSSPDVRNDHSRLLYFLSEAKLNLDDYEGALDVLDQFSEYYNASWYAGSRAWVLMKLNRIDEAIKVAREGLLSGADPGRTLNILGILLSVSGKREESLKIFDEAIRYELAYGKQGQPATPMNNAGEVLNESFREKEAERFWIRAIRLPDGCEHVLPSLNLSTLYIEMADYKNASWAINNFLQCVKMYPLRIGNDYKALVHLAKGRIYRHIGDLDRSIEHLQDALENKQWFGKIGANVKDLKVAANTEIAKSLIAVANRLKFRLPQTWTEVVLIPIHRAIAYIKARWHIKQAVDMLIDDLNAMEDIYIRHSDSLLEYSTMGSILRYIPKAILEKRLKFESKRDDRTHADVYYNAYLAESLLANGYVKKGMELIDDILTELKSPGDNSLRQHLLLTKLSFMRENSRRYVEIVKALFRNAKGELRNYGVIFPVRVNFAGLSGSKYSSKLYKGGFAINVFSPYILRINKQGRNYRLELVVEGNVIGSGNGKSFEEAVNNLNKQVFTGDIL